MVVTGSVSRQRARTKSLRFMISSLSLSSLGQVYSRQATDFECNGKGKWVQFGLRQTTSMLVSSRVEQFFRWREVSPLDRHYWIQLVVRGQTAPPPGGEWAASL